MADVEIPARRFQKRLAANSLVAMASHAFRHIIVLTGAGISADSGLPVFRGPEGLWEGHRPEQLATPEAWAANPELVWRFYQMRRRKLLDVAPNAAHHALVTLERRLRDAGQGFTLVSQNVDDLHQRAGSDVLAMHGQLVRLRCEPCGHEQDDREHIDDRFVACPACGFARMRPAVVWFGEMPHHLEAIEAALSRCSDFISVGTSGAVYPAAGFLARARASGARTHVLSLDAPEILDPRDRFIEGRAIQALPARVERWLEEWAPRATA